MNGKLLSPLVTPAITLRNRVVMAPMSRRRAENGISGATAPLYYSQRAGAGLIIAENSAVAPNGHGYLNVPGIYSEVQQRAWKEVVEAVHAKGGKIFVQLVHTGRIGHPLNQEGRALVAPSVVKAEGRVRTPGDVYLPIAEPEALSTAGVQEMIDAYVQAAVNAIAIGFDGVEVHGAHGYLTEQFLHPYTNRRPDDYGGSITNRSRFLLEIVERTVAAIGADRTGIRLSPFSLLNDQPPYEEEAATHQYLADALEQMGILYIHFSDQSSNGYAGIPTGFIRDIRRRFSRLLIVAGEYTASSGEAVLQDGLADLVGFGRPFIANPDLVERFRRNVPLAAGDKRTYYEGGDGGYIDYPEHSCCV